MKRRSTLVIAVVVMTMGLSALAQSATIEGNIKQEDSTTVLPAVSVYLDKTNIGTATNSNGDYIMEDVPAGSYTIVASAIGYITLKREITVKSDETIEVNFTMKEVVSTLPEVTVMTGGSVGLRDIPGSVHYISPREIEQFGYTDINRTLRTVPGINLQEEDGFGLRPNIGLRGTGVERSSKITLMEDGVLMAPAPYIAPAAYYFPTIGRMQGVEILKGSSQIKYGPYTTGGAINFISTPIPDEFGGRVALLGGSFGGRNLHAFVGNSHKNIGYLVETFQYSSNGFKQLDGGGNTGFNKQDYLAKFRINTNADARIYQSLTFKVGQSQEVSNETYLGLTDEDFAINPYRRYSASQLDQMIAKQLQFSLTHVVEFSEFFKISTTAYRSDFSRNWYKLDKVKDSMGVETKISEILDDPLSFGDAYDILTGKSSTNVGALFVKANNRSYYAQGIQTVFGFNFEALKVGHDIDLGLRIHQDQVDRFQWIDEYAMVDGVMKLIKAGVPGTESNRIGTAQAIAAYLQYQWSLGKLTATSGIRYESIALLSKDYGKSDPDRTGIDLEERSNAVAVFIPGVALDYRFNKYVSSFVGIHKGFSPPGVKEGTAPEESVNYEWGVRYAKNALSGEVIVFFNDYTNLLGADLAAAGGTGTGDLFNGGAVRTKGLEFQATYDVLFSQKRTTLSLPLSLVYTYTDASFQNDFESDFDEWGEVSAGDQLPYIANNQFSIVAGLEHGLFSISLSGRYMDEMRTVPGQGDILDSEKTDSYFVIDAGVSYVLHEHIELFANATNLTNAKYAVARRPAGLRPGMPRAFNIGLRSNF